MFTLELISRIDNYKTYFDILEIINNGSVTFRRTSYLDSAILCTLKICRKYWIELDSFRRYYKINIIYIGKK